VRLRRIELLDAFEDAAPDPVIVAYLALADALIAEGRLLDAVAELEGALILLTPRTGEPPKSLWRISLLLGAMYDRLGNKVRARRAAMDAQALAQRAKSKDGETRTRLLVNRLAVTRGITSLHGDRTANPDELEQPTLKLDGAKPKRKRLAR
jgi:hypothetical protein